jgi:chromosome segregation ATPase
MDDLVHRLRAKSGVVDDSYDHACLIREAADRIEALAGVMETLARLQEQRDNAIRRTECAWGRLISMHDRYNSAQDTLVALRAEIAQVRERAETAEAKLAQAAGVLKWYAEQARLARLIHAEGDVGRHAIANDGGALARAVLSEIAP